MGNCLKGDEIQQPVRQKNPNPYQTNTVSEQDKTILKLKAYRDKLLSQKRALYQNADKAQNEAKVLIKQGKKDRALFALKRKKLYDNMVTDIENQYTIIEKTVIDVEGKIQLSEYTNVLKDTNDLIKSLDTATKLEELQQIGEDIRQREVETREFNKLFEEHHVNDSEVNDLFKQFEAEVNAESSSVVNKSNVRQQASPIRQTNHREVQEEEDHGDQEISQKLAMLA